MDEDIRAAIGDLKSDLKERFDKVDTKIEQLVTRGEFSATVQRIDSERDSLRRDFEAHEKEAPSHRAAAAAKADAVRSEIRTDLEGFRTTTRWAIGIAVPVTGLLVTIGQWLLTLTK